DLFQRRTYERLATRGSDRHSHGQATIAGRRGRVPAGPDEGIALSHQVPSAGVLRGIGVIDGREFRWRLERKVQRQVGNLVTPIGHIEEQDFVAARRIHWLQEIEVGRVLDLAAGVARRQHEVGDDSVEWALGIQFAEGTPHQFLIPPDFTERHATEYRRLDAIDNDFCDHGFSLISWHYKDHECEEKAKRQERPASRTPFLATQAAHGSSLPELSCPL